ncbi:hypothetical protein KSP39_PZI017609 [Platanthera zijinensis]|uniref:MIT domain-containing protein n=1 Tax=Platanthera zijinensis TaxID=2320716 RepID=A0AAP0B5F3_9ASPA
MNALDYFNTHLKYEKNPKIKEAITYKFTEYLRRAEEIHIVLNEGGPGPAANGDVTVVTKPKTKPKDGIFKEQAIEYVKQAVQEDNVGNYVKAFPLYMNALDYFKTYLKYEKNPKMKEAITQNFTEYLRRAEEIHVVLHEGGLVQLLMGTR